MTDKLNIPSLDNHHADIFKMIHLLDDAIKTNSRKSFEPIITFLSTQTLDHFKEERLMKKNNYHDIEHHEREHRRFENKVKSLKKMYDENIHSTHIAYNIRQLILTLIIHTQQVDIKMKGHI